MTDKTPALPEPIASIIAGLKGVTPGPWCADSERSEGGDGTFDAFAVYGPEPRYGRPSSICDTHNSGEVVIQHDTAPWDEQGRVNMDHIARCDPDTMRTIATQLQEALDRADRAEGEFAKIAIHLDAEFDSDSMLHEIMEIQADRDIFKDRATTAEAALEGARKVIEEIADPKKLPSHGDPTVIRDHAAQWLSANPEVKG